MSSNVSGEPLSAGSLATFMSASLPKDAEPQLRNEWDAAALAVHAGMIAVGFRLVGLGEDHRIDASSEAEDTQPLPSEWNAPSNNSNYAFRYKHSQSAMEFLVKVNRLGSKAIVLALAVGHDKTAQFEISVNDYISKSNLPASPAKSDASTNEARKKLQDIFISPGRLADLGALLKLRIIQKLAPGIQKEGYEESQQSTDTDTSSSSNQRQPPQREPERPMYDPLRQPDPPPARPYPFDDPLAAAPRRPHPDLEPPGFEDEHEILRGPRGGIPGGRSPYGIGHDDLYPPGLGPNDPMRPHFGGGIPRPGGMGGGMHPTFDDPMFGGGGGGGGFNPQAPPGSRFDPVHPGQAPQDPRGGMGRGGRFPGGGGGFGGMGGRPPNPFGGFGDGDFI